MELNQAERTKLDKFFTDHKSVLPSDRSVPISDGDVLTFKASKVDDLLEVVPARAGIPSFVNLKLVNGDTIAASQIAKYRNNGLGLQGATAEERLRNFAEKILTSDNGVEIIVDRIKTLPSTDLNKQYKVTMWKPLD